MIQGTVVVEVDLIDGELVSSDATTTGFEFSQTRGVLILDTTDSPGGDLGIIAVVPVGIDTHIDIDTRPRRVGSYALHARPVVG